MLKINSMTKNSFTVRDKQIEAEKKSREKRIVIQSEIKKIKGEKKCQEKRIVT
jgi:hypothetical protein